MLKLIDEGVDFFKDPLKSDKEDSSLKLQAKEWSKAGDGDLFLLVQKLYDVCRPVSDISEPLPLKACSKNSSDLAEKLKISEGYLVYSYLPLWH
jgi:hypothetical protein